MLICSVPILRFLAGKKGLVTDLARELIAESKRQNSWDAAGNKSKR